MFTADSTSNNNLVSKASRAYHGDKNFHLLGNYDANLIPLLIKAIKAGNAAQGTKVTWKLYAFDCLGRCMPDSVALVIPADENPEKGLDPFWDAFDKEMQYSATDFSLINSNEKRAEVGKAILHFLEDLTSSAGESLETQLSDALCYLQHFADSEEINFLECLARGTRNYQSEVE